MTMRLLTAVLLCLTAGLVHAQEYPARNVRLIAPAAPGGNPDVLGRMLAVRLSEVFGRPFVVENVPGAGGVVAAELLAHAAPDGQVLLMGDSGNLAINPVLQRKLAYSPLRDFAFITALAALPTGVRIVQQLFGRAVIVVETRVDPVRASTSLRI